MNLPKSPLRTGPHDGCTSGASHVTGNPFLDVRCAVTAKFINAFDVFRACNDTKENILFKENHTLRPTQSALSMLFKHNLNASVNYMILTNTMTVMA